MQEEQNFKLSEIIHRGKNTTFIGSIDGTPAIIHAQHPQYDEEFFNKCILAEHQVTSQNDIYQTGEVVVDYEMQYKLVYPASLDEISSLKASNRYVTEPYNEYIQRRDSIPEGYVDNLLKNSGIRQDFKVFFEDERFLAIADVNWNGNVDLLSFLLIVKDEKYVTVRDVDDISLVESIKELALSICMELGIDQDFVVIYCDAKPSNRHLHFNVRNISINSFYLPFDGWPILIDDVLKNLSHTMDYYKKDMFYLSNKAVKTADATE